jgi:hypothetical protein
MRRNVKWSGWKNEKPSYHQRTIMRQRCGSKCFLGPKNSFPICKKNTCKISKKGLYSAMIRAREWRKTKKSYKGRSKPRHARSTYKNIVEKAKSLLHL